MRSRAAQAFLESESRLAAELAARTEAEKRMLADAEARKKAEEERLRWVGWTCLRTGAGQGEVGGVGGWVEEVGIFLAQGFGICSSLMAWLSQGRAQGGQSGVGRRWWHEKTRWLLHAGGRRRRRGNGRQLRQQPATQQRWRHGRQRPRLLRRRRPECGPCRRGVAGWKRSVLGGI